MKVYYLLLIVPAAPCSYSVPVSADPAVPFAIPLLLALSCAASGFGTSFPDSTICSVISLFTAVGSCSFILAGVIGSFSLYSVNGSSFLPTSVPGPPSSNSLVCPPPLRPPVEDEETRPTVSLVVLVALSLASVIFSLVVEAPSLVVLATLSLAPFSFSLTLSVMLVICLLLLLYSLLM